MDGSPKPHQVLQETNLMCSSARCEKLLIRLASADIAMFRFLLEAHDNLAYFTVLERKTALLKLVFSQSQRPMVDQAIKNIAKTIPLVMNEWPLKQ